MKHTIIEAHSAEDFQRALNDFDELNPTEKYEKRFTQTHVTVQKSGVLLYTAVVFHN